MSVGKCLVGKCHQARQSPFLPFWRNETEKIDSDFAAARNLNGDLFKGPTAFRGQVTWTLPYESTSIDPMVHFHHLNPTLHVSLS